MKTINKIAKRLKKELGKEITIDKLSTALSKRGFSLLYTDSPEGIEQLEYYKLSDYAKTKKCFTYCSSVKLVFVDGTLHKSDITKLLLHELAHIELRHIGYTDYHIYDEVSAEVEADAVVYSVLNLKKQKKLPFAIAFLIILILNATALYFISNTKIEKETAASSTVQESETASEDSANTVYVTRTGIRYHRKSCRYAKAYDTKALSREEATKTHTPCKVCKP